MRKELISKSKYILFLFFNRREISLVGRLENFMRLISRNNIMRQGRPLANQR